ncbi:hypothetical protein JW906_04040 [bacterium]|nr:hypothetical protein [bacterium]
MKKTGFHSVASGIILFVCCGALHSQESLIEPLECFRPFLGKTWKGVSSDTGSNAAMTDVSSWERALNGRAIRVLHSVNNGEYGGETMLLWDPAQKSLVFFYFTTAGFYTQGTMVAEDGQFISVEKVTGNENGITEVRATAELLGDGRLQTKSSFLKNGQWVDGHSFIYVEEPAAQVIFK